MNTIEFIAEERYDVVVCGSGPAGLGAALAAARCHASVMLLESANLPGGTINAVPWMPVNRLKMKKQKRSYAHDMLVKHIEKLGDTASRPGVENRIDGDGLSCHVEYSELAIYEMLEELGIQYRMFSPVFDVLKDGNRVSGVIVREKRGYVAYHADIVVDATGDGDVAFAAGCEYMEGREEDHIHMPITLGFSLGGINKEDFFAWLGDYKKFNALMDEAHAKGYYIAAWYGFIEGTLPGIIGVNNGAWRNQSLTTDGTNSSDLTKVRRYGLNVATDLVRVLRENHVPGAENCFLDKVGNILGVRDTRRIVGEYVQTFEDSQKSQEFEDTVARKYGFIDANQLYIGPMASGYSYPYRSLVPKNVGGLLVAGRCASASFMGHAAGKSMGNMMELGEAAGAAAALCSRKGVQPGELDVSELRYVLINELEVLL
jgi:hypothetical protein